MRVRIQLPLMLIIQVQVWVKTEYVEAFQQATLENASHSVQEPGIARFDLLQNAEDPTQFLLVEVYRTPQAPAAHKQTAHYQKWRDAVEGMMARPRQSVKYQNLFPDESGW